MPSFPEYLVEQGIISAKELNALRPTSTDRASLVVPALRQSGLIGSSKLAEALAHYHRVALVQPADWPASAVAADLLSTAFLRTNKVYPLAMSQAGVVLAIADPDDTYALRAVRLATGRPVLPRVATLEDIEAALERLAVAQDKLADTASVPAGPAAGQTLTDDVAHLRDLALGTPVVRLLNQLIEDAVAARATDIHIEPYDGRLSVRVRVDGMLRDVRAPPASMGKAVVSRIKMLAGLDIAERRLPQDGRSRVRVDGRQLDLRVATMPTIHGESVAIRILDNVRRTLDLERLGFTEQQRGTLARHLGAPYGMFIVTGPTGSGKTTTLAAALSMLNTTKRKIVTIEDPIEYEIDGVNQTQAKPAIGLDFASALRSFLRHDPDVIMVGEMRDAETALIAVQAALTGHIVLTTLHTNSAIGAIPRLLDLGVDAYLLASSLRCIVGQRLVRLLCPACKVQGETEPVSIGTKGGPGQGVSMRPWHATGCDRCYGTGYADRIAIAEVLDIDDAIRPMIRPGVSTVALEAAARAVGYETMIADGLAKCAAGLTSPAEISRVALEL